MLNWAILFLGLTIVSAVLGFAGAIGAENGIAKISAFVFLILAIVSFILRERVSI